MAGFFDPSKNEHLGMNMNTTINERCVCFCFFHDFGFPVLFIFLRASEVSSLVLFVTGPCGHWGLAFWAGARQGLWTRPQDRGSWGQTFVGSESFPQADMIETSETPKKQEKLEKSKILTTYKKHHEPTYQRNTTKYHKCRGSSICLIFVAISLLFGFMMF